MFASVTESESLADLAHELVVEYDDHIACGTSGDPYFFTKKVFSKFSRFWSKRQIEEIEEIVLNHFPEEARRTDELKYRGMAQWELLLSLDEERLSERAKKARVELNRKFESLGIQPSKPFRHEGGFVTSPVPTQSIKKLTLENWLTAIKKYNGTRGFDRDLRGDAFELSSELEKVVVDDPELGLGVLFKLDENSHTAYFNAVLRGLKGSEEGYQNLVKISEYLLSVRPIGCGDWFCDLVASFSKFPIPQSVLDSVSRFATNDPDPKPETDDNRDLAMIGLNSVRGRAARAIGALLFDNDQLYDKFSGTIKALLKDKHEAVRAEGVYCLLPLLKSNRAEALDMFVEYSRTAGASLGSRSVNDFIYYTNPGDFSQLKPVLTSMIGSRDTDIKKVAARQICIISLSNDDAKDLVDICLSGEEDIRAIVASIFAANITHAACRDKCVDGLIQLFSDQSEEVCADAARCFSDMKGNDLDEFRELAEAYIRSSNTLRSSHYFVDAMGNSTSRISNLVIKFGNKFLEIVGQDAGDIRTASAGEAKDIVGLIMKSIHVESNRDSKKQLLDLLDKYIEIQAYGLDDHLSEFDRL